MVCRKIDISPSFIAFLCAYYYFDPMHTFAAFLLSATLHELGHLTALLVYRIPIQQIRLRAFGTQIITPCISNAQELFVASAGPAVNFLLLILGIRKAPMLALVNLILLIYNLLPIFPLDGGRILRAILSLLLPYAAVHIAEQIISTLCTCVLLCLCAYLTCVWHAGLWPILLAAMLFLRITSTIFPERRKKRV